MADYEIKVPKVFISYSQDSPEHNARVLAFSDRLVKDGVHCNIDQYIDSPPEGWLLWMERQIDEADFVLVICTARYLRRVHGEEKPDVENGVRWESVIVYQALFDARMLNTKFIPILFEGASSSDIPIPIKSATRYILTTEDEYIKLYRHLTNQPSTPKPELGKLCEMSARERKADFFSPTTELALKNLQEPLTSDSNVTSVPSEQEETSSSEKSTNGTQRVLTRQQLNTCQSINRHYTGIKEMQKTVRDAHRFFSTTQLDIFSDQCQRMINPVLTLNRPIQNFNAFLKKAHLPTNVHQLCSQLIKKLNHVEVLLNELISLKKNCCPDGLKAPIKQRQNIQYNLKDIASSLNEVNSLIRSFNKEVGLSENEVQSAEAVNTAQPARESLDHLSLTSVATNPNRESTLFQSLQNKSYDVFLSYNSKDEAEVKKIAQELKARGIVPWLDEWELPPGRPAQRGLEAEIMNSKSAAIFIGKDGLGPWQHMELNAFIQQFVNRDCPVIPVILSHAPPGKPQLPAFLEIMTWVDFRMQEPDPIKQLIWGITNKKHEADNSKSISGGIQTTAAATRQSVQLSFLKEAELANKLLPCSCMSNKISRQTVLDKLNDEFPGLTYGIAYGNDDRTDVMNIISKCRDNPGSLQMLVKIVTFFEGETSTNTRQLKDFMRDNDL